MSTPFKQRNNPFRKKKEKRKTKKEKQKEKEMQEKFHNLEVPEPPVIPSDTTKT